MNVPFLDLGRLHQSIAGELQETIDRVVGASAFIGGRFVQGFEEAFCEAASFEGVAGCNSGTDAISLALRALGIGVGDEVIVPSMTFVATAEAVVHVGAVPVLADVDPVNLLLTEEAVAEVRTSRTRAVIPVHLYGNPVPSQRIRNWRDAGLIVVEDAAQAHLATWNAKPIGQEGHATTFSFFPGKNLGAFGDAGAVASQDPTLIDEVRLLRDHGRSSKYIHDRIGYSSRMDGLQAAILETKLRHLPEWTRRRQERARWYFNDLHEADVLLPWAEGAVHHLLVIRIGAGRDEAKASLAEDGIATGIHYPIALSQQPALQDWKRSTPVAESAAAEVLSLPLDPLMGRESVRYVAESLKACQ